MIYFSLDFIKIELQTLRYDIDDIEERVCDTEGDVNLLKKKEKRHNDEIKDVIQNLVGVNEKVEIVKTDLVETNLKVEEIDNKVYNGFFDNHKKYMS